MTEPKPAAPQTPASTCPGEAQLMPLAKGETVSNELSHHVEQCPACTQRVKRLRDQVALWKSIGSELAGQSRDQSDADTEPAPGRKSLRRTPKLPRAIGGYRIKRRLDSGGQAEIFVGEDEFGREVIIKRAHRPAPRTGQDHFRHRLLEEGQILADLSELRHPNLVHVYAMDFDDENRPYLVMEYVKGVTLFQYARQRRVNPRRAARIVLQLAEALGPVHRHGITHRDITPRNVILDTDENPRLIDFGLARVQSAWHDPIEPYGYSGGTVNFRAPEQVMGQSDRISPRTDVWALGALLRFLLSAKRERRAEPEWSSDPIDRKDESASAEVPAKTTAIPAALQRIVAKATAEEPDERYDTAAELAEELQHYVLSARRKRQWWTVVPILAVAMIILAGVIAWDVLRPPPMPPMDQPLIQFQHATKLDDALPMQSQDRWRVQAQIPRGWRALLVAIEPSGQVRFIDFKRAGQSNGYDQIDAPNGIDYFTVNEAGEKHSAALLLLATPRSLTETDRQHIRDAIAAVVSPGGLPLLDPTAAVFVSHDRVWDRTLAGDHDRVDNRDLLGEDAIVTNPDRDVMTPLDALRLKLSADFPFIDGVAIGQYPRPH